MAKEMSARAEAIAPVGQQHQSPASRYPLWARVEYDGTDFFGFQIQAGERTVQGEIERAIAEVTGAEARVIGAGRTDRGVHAQGQVIAFEAAWRHSLADLQRALNAVLPADLSVQELGIAPEGFHPRFSALSRTYRYTLLNQPWRSPLARRAAWHVVQPLDLGLMVQASQCLVGTHDFAAFGEPPQGENSVRTVARAQWHGEPPWLAFDIEANAFLYRMVRSLVGTMVLVGSARMPVAEFRAILSERERKRVKQLAPARGLCLLRVNYQVPVGAGPS